MHAISEFYRASAEAGVGLAIRDEAGRYLFFLAGTRHHYPPGELFYAGIGGHQEPDEDWLACAHREAHEEVGTDVQVLSAPVTWYIPQRDVVQRTARAWPVYCVTHWGACTFTTIKTREPSTDNALLVVMLQKLGPLFAPESTVHPPNPTVHRESIASCPPFRYHRTVSINT